MDQSFLSTLVSAWAPYAVYWLIWYVVPGGLAAYYVYQDGIKRMPLALNIHPGAWALFCFASGAWGLLAYWIIEHSSLRK
jgi:hypothetical protein